MEGCPWHTANMTKTIYVIGPKALFDVRFAEFQQGTGFYYNAKFSNWGSINHSNDNTLTLLEEKQEKFDPADLAREDVQTFTHSELQQYLNDNYENWHDMEQ